MTTKAGTLLDILKKKLTQAKEEAEKYQEEAEENQRQERNCEKFSASLKKPPI